MPAVSNALTRSGSSVDGTKVALARDGSRALVVWNELRGQYRRTRYMVLDDLGTGPILLPVAQTLDEVIGWEPPNMASEGHVRFCLPGETDPDVRYRQSFAEGHPVGAVGPSGTLYIARVHQYVNLGEIFLCGFAPGGIEDPNRELEVFRFTGPDGPGKGGTWERIYSVQAPVEDDQLRAAGGLLTDSSTRPAITVVSDGERDTVLLALTRNTVNRQSIEIVRIAEADICSTTSFYRESCSTVERYALHERIQYEFGQQVMEADDPLHHMAFQPAIYAGDSVSTPTADPRVGLHYYWQPYRHDPAATPEEEEVTLVVGLTSDDGGQSWRVPQLPVVFGERTVAETLGYELTLPIPGRASVYSDPRRLRAGEVFAPCSVSGGYFGHYNGGVFQTEDPAERQAVATWADSRESACDRTLAGWTTTPQHVYSARFPSLTIAP